jgi:hypothetical protein
MKVKQPIKWEERFKNKDDFVMWLIGGINETNTHESKK